MLWLDFIYSYFFPLPFKHSVANWPMENVVYNGEYGFVQGLAYKHIEHGSNVEIGFTCFLSVCYDEFGQPPCSSMTQVKAKSLVKI